MTATISIDAAEATKRRSNVIFMIVLLGLCGGHPQNTAVTGKLQPIFLLGTVTLGDRRPGARRSGFRACCQRALKRKSVADRMAVCGVVENAPDLSTCLGG